MITVKEAKELRKNGSCFQELTDMIGQEYPSLSHVRQAGHLLLSDKGHSAEYVIIFADKDSRRFVF
jgi:hypothetical protein